MIFGVWHGGVNYSSMDFRGGMEAFSSESEAKSELLARYHGSCHERRVVFDKDGYGQIKGSEYCMTPVVDRDSYTDLYQGVEKHLVVMMEDGTVGYVETAWIIDDSPYARLYFGPRGGVRKENY